MRAIGAAAIGPALVLMLATGLYIGEDVLELPCQSVSSSREIVGVLTKGVTERHNTIRETWV